MNKKIAYSNYCIAYLDILGFKNIVNSETASTIHEIFSNVRFAKKLISGGTKEKDIFCEIRKKTKFYFFSDSIVCSIPMEEPMAFEMVASNCMLLQHVHWVRGLQVWVRGAITIGNLFCGQSEVFGPALVEAYTLESKDAKYPRIVMTEETYKQGIANSDNKEDIGFILKTDNELRMVECLRSFSRYESTFRRLIESVEKNIREITELRVREKYVWIKKNYYDLFDDLNETRSQM